MSSPRPTGIQFQPKLPFPLFSNPRTEDNCDPTHPTPHCAPTEAISMASFDKATESYKKALTAAASLAGSAMLFRSVVNEFLPPEVQSFLLSSFNIFRTRAPSEHTIVIEETEGYSSNQIYEAAKIYLSTRINPSMKRLRVSRADETKSMVISLDPDEEMIDVFEGIEFKWRLVCQESEGSHNNNSRTELRSFEVSFHEKHKDKALNSYLPSILARAKAIKDEDKALHLYMNEGDSWFQINLHHPSTFGTLAMEEELKRTVMDDLARFVKRKDYYKRIGKAWKRGYLLYGPPGTGKSSLIAAMANHLKFDIYDLELTEVGWNSTLKRLLVGMSNRSILVIEDIDCTIDLQQREEDGSSSSSSSGNDKVTLSGLLNFVDGLWSTSGEERIIVFTTNYKERLDPALLRPGRMDMHIHMGYCGPHSFRVLASNYHAIDDHPLFPQIEGLVREVEVTPAEVAEQLMRSDDTDAALQGLLEFLQGKEKNASGANGEDEGVENVAGMDPGTGV
ncbi:AAA-ATPase At3g50940 [Elaeis guineensis]|uniref:AAA-ATPase At3g50940 n=1 Tax=Elaeis guineensis var. tenera TaxID=51953 RepID=A0A6I9REL3_ELAGV|nr:AAA-ATPase At3g50940 [Elaeis guineensis]